MCGIAGIIGSHPLGGALAAMTAAMSHRGPDGHGCVHLRSPAGHLELGSTRLAILDLSPAGNMPMQDTATGNWIVYNGEVYNFRELRRELESAGGTFSSGTDTEVVLKGYGRWGPDVVRRLRGMFAFAIWDNASGELFLARDRLGEKPLYFGERGGEFLFASEVRALLASGRIDRRLDAAALHVFLFNGFLVSPLTLVRGVRSLLPGHWMRVGAGGRVLEKTQYWRPVPSSPGNGELADRIEDAVRSRLVSDAPLGAFLSGGLDSSTVVAMIARAGVSPRTFSVAFDEAEYDESDYSRWVAARFRTSHNEVRLRQEKFHAWLDDAMEAMDQPSFDGVNTYCVSRAARANGLTVALSGLGADELFGGYPFFRTIPWLKRAVEFSGRVRGRGRNGAGGLLGGSLRVSAPWKLAEAFLPAGYGTVRPVIASYQSSQLLFPWWVRRELVQPPLLDGARGLAFGLPGEFLAVLNSDLEAAGPDNHVSLLALRLFLGERCLRDTDATSMAVSLEVRTTFTDHLLLEAALSVPARERCANPPHKNFQWNLVRPCLGEDYPRRGKRGFLFPFETWLRDPRVLRTIEHTLADATLLESCGLNPSAVERLVLAHRQRRPRIPWSRTWALFSLARWCHRHRVSL